MRSNDNSGSKTHPKAAEKALLPAWKVREIIAQVEKATVDEVVYLQPARSGDHICDAKTVASWRQLVPVDCKITTPAAYLAHRLMNELNMKTVPRNVVDIPALILAYANFPDGISELPLRHQEMLVERFGHEAEDRAIAQNMRRLFVADKGIAVGVIATRRKEPSKEFSPPTPRQEPERVTHVSKISPVGAAQKVVPTGIRLRFQKDVQPWKKDKLMGRLGEVVQAVKDVQEALGLSDNKFGQLVGMPNIRTWQAFSSASTDNTQLAWVDENAIQARGLMMRLHEMLNQQLFDLPKTQKKADAQPRTLQQKLEAALVQVDEIYQQITVRDGKKQGILTGNSKQGFQQRLLGESKNKPPTQIP